MKTIPYLDLKEVNATHANELCEAVARVVKSGWYLCGQEVARFEESWAAYIGAAHCVGVGNGLDALTLTLKAHIVMGRMRPGDEVIVPAHTFLATVLAITDTGLAPVFADVNPVTLELDPACLRRLVTPRTRALMLVHLYGRCAYSQAIGKLCGECGLTLIEDNAQAHGCRFGDRRTGSLGQVGCHSFYPGKNLGALGDGGAVTTDDAELAATVRTLANYGFRKKYEASLQGRNSRLDEIQAAALSVKLAYLDTDNSRRSQLADLYRQTLSNPLVTLPPPTADPAADVHHIFPVFCDHRDRLRQHLESLGVQTLIHYPIPPHKQECYPQWNGLSLPGAEAIARTELSLPLHPAMSDGDIRRVAEAVNSFY